MMSDFWTPGMSACTSMAFSFCAAQAENVSGNQSQGAPRQYCSISARPDARPACQPEVLDARRPWQQVSCRLQHMYCRWAPEVNAAHDILFSCRCLWMLPEARIMQEHQRVCGATAHLHDIDGDAALRRHAGGRPPELAVEVEDGREEQVIREDGRESLHVTRHTMLEARCERLPAFSQCLR